MKEDSKKAELYEVKAWNFIDQMRHGLPEREEKSDAQKDKDREELETFAILGKQQLQSGDQIDA